jgi:hypothetical protein
MKLLDRYLDHPQAETRLTSKVALVVGGNGPFYPLYLYWLTPEAGPVALLTMVAAPLFLAVPLIARMSGPAAQMALVLTGLANVLWCTALLGPASGVPLFALPCVAIALTAWRRQRVMLALLGLCLAAQQAAMRWPWPPLTGLAPERQADLLVMNATSVGALTAFLVLAAAGELRRPAPHALPPFG